MIQEFVFISTTYIVGRYTGSSSSLQLAVVRYHNMARVWQRPQQKCEGGHCPCEGVDPTTSVYDICKGFMKQFIFSTIQDSMFSSEKWARKETGKFLIHIILYVQAGVVS